MKISCMVGEEGETKSTAQKLAREQVGLKMSEGIKTNGGCAAGVGRGGGWVPLHGLHGNGWG